MSEKVSTLERDIICKAFEGSFVHFPLLRSQVDNLLIKHRSEDEGDQYLVEFEDISDDELRIKDEADCFHIVDTVLLINESDEVLDCRITIIDGSIRYFDISGDYDFDDNFTIKKVKWANESYDDGKYARKMISKSDERDYENAIEYIPKYK